MKKYFQNVTKKMFSESEQLEIERRNMEHAISEHTEKGYRTELALIKDKATEDRETKLTSFFENFTLVRGALDESTMLETLKVFNDILKPENEDPEKEHMLDLIHDYLLEKSHRYYFRQNTITTAGWIESLKGLRAAVADDDEKDKATFLIALLQHEEDFVWEDELHNYFLKLIREERSEEFLNRIKKITYKNVFNSEYHSFQVYREANKDHYLEIANLCLQAILDTKGETRQNFAKFFWRDVPLAVLMRLSEIKKNEKTFCDRIRAVTLDQDIFYGDRVEDYHKKVKKTQEVIVLNTQPKNLGELCSQICVIL